MHSGLSSSKDLVEFIVSAVPFLDCVLHVALTEDGLYVLEKLRELSLLLDSLRH